jgi:hypothetical protein
MSQKQSSLDTWLTPTTNNSSPTTNNTQQPTSNNNNYQPTRRRQQMRPHTGPIRQHKRRKTTIANIQLTTLHPPTIQTRLSNNTSTIQVPTSNCQPWGDTMGDKQDGTLRIAFRNISSLPAHIPNSKHDELLFDIKQAQFDLIGLVETNVCWQHVNVHDRPHNRFKPAFENVHVSYSNNTHNLQTFEKRQQGGTMILALSSLCHRTINSGADPTGLGRWSWVLLTGKEQNIRLICVYRPVQSTNVSGVYRQQQTYLLEHNDNTCPRQRLLLDLRQQINECKQLGERIIVMGDFNDNVTENPIAQFFDSLNLIELIHLKHGKHAPNTYVNGSKPIDGIFGSRELAPIKSGYSAITWGATTDHRLLWVDIDESQALNLKPIPYWTPKARRLKLEDPRIVTKFLTYRRTHAICNKLLERTITLQNLLSTEHYDRSVANQEAQTIDTIRSMGIMAADHQCRKLPMGQISWTPQLTAILYHIRYYKLVCASLSGTRVVNSRTLLKTRNLAKIENPVKDLVQAQDLLNSTFVKFNAYKKNSISLRHTH